MIMKNKAKLVIIVLLASIYSCEKQNDPTSASIKINELMPVNKTTVADQNGEFDDWIELYNISETSADISGYYLSDKKSNYAKWQLPQGTTISGKGYLTIWCDKDTTQAGLHTNFKLSSSGETVILSSEDGTLLDKVAYPEQSLELSYSRNPDGIGEFKWQRPTYNSSNNIIK